MRLLEKILVPVKISETSGEQLSTAVELAGKFNSELILLQILPVEALNSSVKSLILGHIDSDFNQVLSRLDSKGIRARKVIKYGNIFDKILNEAETENVNLILINNELIEKDDRYSLDILAEKLIRKSPKPVWVVKPGYSGMPKKILCTVDYSDASVRALKNANRIARIFAAKLFVINVLESMEEKYSVWYNIDYEQENRKREVENSEKFDKFIQQFNFTKTDFTGQILLGKTEKQIIGFIEDNGIDLLFMGATGKTFIQRVLLGSVTESILRELPSSMVITKSENILNLKIDADISGIEKHFAEALKLEQAGYVNEAIDHLEICLQINDLHIPVLDALVRLYDKTGNRELAVSYRQKVDEILKRLWDKKIELEIRRVLNLK